MIAHYRLLLAFHIIAVISWMAGILYLYRLFVYHAAETEAVVKSRFVVMEKRLYSFITVPAMAVSFLLGIALVSIQPDIWEHGWLRMKLVLVLALAFMTLWAGKVQKLLELERCRISSKTFRYLNELPTLLMIGIVLLVILKPF